MHITTLPVYSKLADPADLPDKLAGKLPSGWQLSMHQLATYQALCDDQVDVVINTAMTGDGKSLAAYLPTLIDPDRTAFGMYPTNELARDQRRQFENYNRDFSGQLSYTSLSGESLGSFIADHPQFARRAEALSALMHDYSVLLTNPDIFHLIINYRYGSHILSLLELPSLLNLCYKHYIFDEFHIFNTPQMVSAITAMLFLSVTASPQGKRRPRFLFSSATPDPVFADLLRASGLRIRHIHGTYDTKAANAHRHVLHGADLYLHKLGEQQNTEQWVRDNLALIENHWRTAAEPRPKGVIIVNSVVEARRIAQFLKASLKHLRIDENTGLVDTERRKAAMTEADLIVGTSTIDVGVDFNISLLIFDAPDAGTFLQRFGRLGRVRRNEPPFAHYEAHALFNGKTPWIYDNFVKALAERQVFEGDAIDRHETLRDTVQAAFPVNSSFSRYVRRWGALQAAHIIAGMENRRLGGSYADAAANLRLRYQQTLGLKDIGSALGRYYSLLNSKNEPASPQCKAILDEVLTFRGSSPFQAVVWDDSSDPPAFINYDAFVIAQNSDLCLADAEPFYEALAERYPDEQTRRAVLQRFRYGLQRGDDPLVLYVEQFWDERERLILQIDRFEPKRCANQVILLQGLSIKKPRNEDTSTLNSFLRKQRVVGYITQKDAKELRRRLRLPAFFPLYSLEDSYEKSYTLALGQAALLLEAEALRLKNKDEEQEPIIC
jgi:CRISPR-associated endonuclease/helicase Cas3